MIIVTGGAGMIGSNIVKLLNARGQNNILVVDNLTNGNKFINLVDLQISDYMDKNEFLKKIISNNVFGKIQAIFHKGACSTTTELNGKYMLENNYEYSKILLCFCQKHKIPFLYASSAAIYGARINNFIEKNIYEKPLNVYGYSKMLFDRYIQNNFHKLESQVCGLRYFNVYGPRENHKQHMASIIFQIYKQIIDGNNPILFEGSNDFKRDFIYVNDIAEINIWFWEKNISGIYNCGTGYATSFQEVANIILKYHNKTYIEHIPFPTTLKFKYQCFTKANLQKLRETGYNKNFMSIKQGILKYISWLKEHQWN